MKNKRLLFAIIFVIQGCSNMTALSNEEQEIINHCSQKNFQCESQCRNTSVEQSLSHAVCTRQCIEQDNSCKAALDETSQLN